ncbi:MAG: aminotransferase class I/II-fold pyridoxal phosphate-dependent enzyme, partial [Victivallales bacterium]|nr:aminotransferase class I/II-fold pyridoxal phosphate-dependent enzyme [Victivallales bacterium]
MKEQPTPPMAESLNKDIAAPANCVMDLLSERGKLMYFPFKGILGQSAQAKGKGINATIGTAFEEDGSPMVLDCVKSSLNVPASTFLYTPSFGLPDIREEWRRQILRKNPSLDGKLFSLPVVTGALTHALYLAGFLFVNEGDEIVMPDFYWDNYELVFETSFGAKISTFQTFESGGYNVKGMIDRLRCSSSNKKILLLNFPNNPTGYTVTDDEAMQIKEGLLGLASEGAKVLVILDDAYFGLAYEKDICRESLFAMLADLHENVLAVKLDGPTKEDYVWSFRVGFATFA